MKIKEQVTMKTRVRGLARLLFAAFLLIVTQTTACGAGVAAVKEKSHYSDATADPFIYSEMIVDGPFVMFTTNGRAFTVEGSRLAGKVDILSSMPYNITNQNELGVLRRSLKGIQDFSTKCPKGAPLLAAHASSLENAIKDFEGGKVRSNGVWMTKEEFVQVQAKQKKDLADKMARQRKVLEEKKVRDAEELKQQREQEMARAELRQKQAAEIATRQPRLASSNQGTQPAGGSTSNEERETSVKRRLRNEVETTAVAYFGGGIDGRKLALESLMISMTAVASGFAPNLSPSEAWERYPDVLAMAAIQSHETAMAGAAAEATNRKVANAAGFTTKNTDRSEILRAHAQQIGIIMKEEIETMAMEHAIATQGAVVTDAQFKAAQAARALMKCATTGREVRAARNAMMDVTFAITGRQHEDYVDSIGGIEQLKRTASHDLLGGSISGAHHGRTLGLMREALKNNESLAKAGLHKDQAATLGMGAANLNGMTIQGITDILAGTESADEMKKRILAHLNNNKQAIGALKNVGVDLTQFASLAVSKGGVRGVNLGLARTIIKNTDMLGTAVTEEDRLVGLETMLAAMYKNMEYKPLRRIP